MIRIPPRAISTAAALFALLMLSFASVQSVVMQAAMGPPGSGMPICGVVDPSNAPAVAMASKELHQAIAASSPDHHQGVPQQHHNVCPYCSAAAHAPLLAQGLPLRQATACEFAAHQAVASRGPLGPPARQPRARGPPIQVA